MKILAFILAAGLAADASAAGPVFPAEGLKSVYAGTEAGAIRFTGGEVKQVSVEITDNDPALCEITAKTEGGALKLVAKGHRNVAKKTLSNLFGLLSVNSSAPACRAGFKVLAPASLDLDLDTASGGISVQNVTGKLEMDTASGPINGSACAKSVSADSASGDISLSGLCGPLTADSASGDLEFSWAKAPANGLVKAGTASGNVRLVFPAGTKMTVTADTASGRVRNEFGAETGLDVRLDTASGDISILKAN